MGSNAHFFVAMVFGVMIVGLILRYGNSSHEILSDINMFTKTLTLQNPNTTYYGQ